MFSNFLNPQSERRSRSKSPAGRGSRETNDQYSPTGDEPSRYRKTSKSKYSDTESDADSIPETPRYVERTPDAYGRGPSKDDPRRSRRADDYEDERLYSRRPEAKYPGEALEDERTARLAQARRERDSYSEAPKSSRSNGSAYMNGDPSQYAASASMNNARGFPAARAPPSPNPAPSRPGQYADLQKVQYAKVDPNTIQYRYNNGDGSDRLPSYPPAYNSSNADPGRSTRPTAPAQQRQYSDDRYARKESRHTKADKEEDRDTRMTREQPRRQSFVRERSPNPSGLSAEQLRRNLGRLSTGGAAGGTLGVGGTPLTAGARPPASPLLEAYKGTYQTISPLPSPLALAVRRDDDMSDLDLSTSDASSDDEITKKIHALQREKKRVAHQKKLETSDLTSPRLPRPNLEVANRKSRAGSTASTTSTRSRKAVSFYDPEADAEKIADALKGSHRTADVRPLLKIMPWLTTDEIIHLKGAYKNHAKINGQGINLSKHIKARVPGNLGKIIYATSLGQYESDAYWANCFYQSGASRRELLIESLVGRSNQQIREIKDVFKDKRYDDDLEKCMKAELKADKFRTAILLALDEKRMPEGLGLDMRRVHEDGLDLYQAIRGEGGESAMIKIVMLRSDDHLREVLRYYEKSYRRNFARDMISKSQNLVGETLAHILNGALNRPMRDALLLHQAIDEFAPQSSAHPRAPSSVPTKPAVGRAELLISRVIRLHWEPKHLEKVKAEYEERYRESVVRAMARDVQGGMKTEEGKQWAGFAMDLIRSSEA